MNEGKRLFERLRKAVPGAVFMPPATELQIVRAERKLKIEMPKWLRELYWCCNGIKSEKFGDPHLYELEVEEEGKQSLVSWNLFLRDECEEYFDRMKEERPDVDWNALDLKHRLILGTDNAEDWAIDLRTGGKEIHDFTIRDLEVQDVLATDLAEMLASVRRKHEEIEEQLWRGREPVRSGDPMKPSNDVEMLLQKVIGIHMGFNGMPMPMPKGISTGWHLSRGISQRKGEGGMLFILDRNGFDIQVATRDGNLPFVLRAKVGFQEEPLRCLVTALPEAIRCVFFAVEQGRWGVEDKGEREARAAQSRIIWKQRDGAVDEELEVTADVLFARDDRRMEEENRMGA